MVFRRSSENWLPERLSKGAKLSPEVGAQLKIISVFETTIRLNGNCVYIKICISFKLRRNVFTLTCTNELTTESSDEAYCPAGSGNQSVIRIENVLSLRARNQNVCFVSDNFRLCVLFEQTLEFMHHWDTFFFRKKLPVLSGLPQNCFR